MLNEGRERRRHPRCVLPIPVECRGDGSEFRTCVGDLSEGGVSFSAEREVRPGSVVDVELPVGNEAFVVHGTVVRCERCAEAGEYRVAVRFEEAEERFRAKLGEQLMRIRELQRELSRRRGVDVTEEQAAKEWVRQHAGEFAAQYDS